MATKSRDSAAGSRSSSPGSASGKSSKREDRAGESIDAFRAALDRSVTLSRDRLQEVVDEAVERGRMTRGDANELVSKLVTRGRRYSDDLVHDLERLLEGIRAEVGARARPARRQATRAAGRAARAARDTADPALAEADRIRRRAGVAGGSPITAYDQLTAAQVRARLRDLGPAELRRVRTQEERGKARKTVLREIDRLLAG